MMKHLLLILIKIYWLTIPKVKRRKCLFKISCSKYVYEKTAREGFISGFKAFKFRFQNCRSEAKIIKNPLTGNIQIILPYGKVIDEQEISDRLIQ